MQHGQRLFRLLIALLILAGGWQLGEGGYIKAKAWLAQVLLQSAWDASREGKERVYPWPWADTWPLARLQVARLGVDQIVLSGASGRSLAFGPGHLPGTAPPGAIGNTVLSGHRDTHFGFLRDLRPGDRILLTPANGEDLVYAVLSAEVHSENDLWLLEQDESLLTLITCYPFDALIPGGTGRFVVRASPLPPNPRAGVHPNQPTGQALIL